MYTYVYIGNNKLQCSVGMGDKQSPCFGPFVSRPSFMKVYLCMYICLYKHVYIYVCDTTY
jgi:hypothetical protein